MKFYKVFKKSHEKNEHAVLVQAGFCWKNFFFGIVWAAYNRIWDLVLIHLLFTAVFYSIDEILSNLSCTNYCNVYFYKCSFIFLCDEFLPQMEVDKIWI